MRQTGLLEPYLTYVKDSFFENINIRYKISNVTLLYENFLYAETYGEPSHAHLGA